MYCCSVPHQRQKRRSVCRHSEFLAQCNHQPFPATCDLYLMIAPCKTLGVLAHSVNSLCIFCVWSSARRYCAEPSPLAEGLCVLLNVSDAQLLPPLHAYTAQGRRIQTKFPGLTPTHYFSDTPVQHGYKVSSLAPWRYHCSATNCSLLNTPSPIDDDCAKKDMVVSGRSRFFVYNASQRNHFYEVMGARYTARVARIYSKTCLCDHSNMATTCPKRPLATRTKGYYFQ